MEKLLDLFLKTPLAKRMAAGLLERGLLAAGMAIATWLQIDSAEYQSELAKFVAEAVPYAVAAIFGLIALKRIKKAEQTIEVARSMPADTPRPVVDAVVKAQAAPGA